MFVSKYWHEINATGVKFCITPSLSVYEHLEDKWYVAVHSYIYVTVCPTEEMSLKQTLA